MKNIFKPQQTARFLNSLVKNRTADADEAWPFDDFEDAEVEASDVVHEAENVILIDRAKELLCAQS